MNRAIIYIRVSTAEQVERISLDYQLKVCQEFAAKSGMSVDQVFREEGESAKTANRPELIRAIDYCRKNKNRIASFIVYKLDRFARNAEDHYAVRSSLSKLGIQLISATEPIDDSPTGKFMESILAAVAEFDNSVRAERTRGGMQARVEQGGWVHKAVLGYVNHRDELGRPTMRVDPTNGPLMQQTLRQFLTGNLSQSEITAYANDLGLRQASGNPISVQTMHKILRNPLYAGLVINPSTKILAPGLHPGLITEEEYYEVQSKLSPRTTPPEHHLRDNARYPLRRGFLRCADCNSSLRGSASRGRSRYYAHYHCVVCRSSRTGNAISERIEVVHEQFDDLLRCIQPKRGMLDLFAELVRRRWRQEQKAEVEAGRALESQVKKLEATIERVTDLYVDGELSDTQHAAKLARIEDQLCQLRGRAANEKKITSNLDVVLRSALLFMANVTALWEQPDIGLGLHFIKLIFPEGLAYKFGGGWWHPTLGLGFALIGDAWAGESTMVALDEDRWLQLKEYLQALAAFIEAHKGLFPLR